MNKYWFNFDSLIFLSCDLKLSFYIRIYCPFWRRRIFYFVYWWNIIFKKRWLSICICFSCCKSYSLIRLFNICNTSSFCLFPCLWVVIVWTWWRIFLLLLKYIWDFWISFCFRHYSTLMFHLRPILLLNHRPRNKWMIFGIYFSIRCSFF